MKKSSPCEEHSEVHFLMEALRILSGLLGCKVTTAFSHQGEVHFLKDVFRVGID